MRLRGRIARGGDGLVCSFGFAGGCVDIASRLIALAALFAVFFVPGAAFAVDAVAPQPIRTYTADVCGQTVSGPLGVVTGAMSQKYAECQTQNTTYNGCPVRQTWEGAFQWTRDGAPNYMYGRFVGNYKYVGTGTAGSCATLNISSNGSTSESVVGRWAEVMGCESGSHMVSGNLCACDPGYNVQSGKCKQYTCPPSGSYSAVTQPDQKVANAGDGQCSGGCSYTPSSWKVGADGQIWATWPFKSTGKFCGGDPKPGTTDVDSGEKNTNNPAPIPCGANQCPGTVNGQAVCVPCKGQQEQGPSSSASAPAGAASGAQTGSSDTKTTCDGVSCTTTTTTKDANGNVTGTVDKTQKQESFCKENPQSSLCKQSSFGGACAATTCEGDAVQCAIAADQYKRNCQWFDDPATDGLKQKGDAAMTGELQGGDHPANAATSQSVSFASTIDQTDRLGGGCPQDVVVTVLGKSITMPMSKACAPLQLVGQLAVAVTMLICAFIVFK